MSYNFGNIEDFYRANVMLEFGAKGNGTTDDTTAINNALASGAPQVFFPPGTYKIDGYVVGSMVKQALIFDDGAILQITPNSGNITLSGDSMYVSGLNVQIISGSSATFTAINLSAVNITINRFTFSVLNADISNATLIRITEDRIHINELHIISDGRSFYRGLHCERTTNGEAGTECGYIVVNGCIFELGDSGVDKTFDCLVYWRVLQGDLHNFYFIGGGRTIPNTCIVIDGHRNNLHNPRIFTFGATYGIRSIDLHSEFLNIFGGHIQGRNNGTFISNSAGIFTGHACGHLKLYGTSVSGWESGIIIHGSHDTPGFYGAVIANNQLQGIKIDGYVDGLDFPVSGLTMLGCYGESQLLNSTQIYIHVVSGSVRGGTLNGCFVSYKDRFVKVDGYVGGSVGFSVENCRISSINGGGDAVFEPHSLSSFYFGSNNLHNVSVLSTDLTKIYQYNNPILSGLVIGTKNTGSALNNVTKYITDLKTANFGNIDGYSGVTLNIMYSDVPTISTAALTVTMDNNLGSKAIDGIIFQWWINNFGVIQARAYNTTPSTINSVTGGVRFTITVFG